MIIVTSECFTSVAMMLFTSSRSNGYEYMLHGISLKNTWHNATPNKLHKHLILVARHIKGNDIHYCNLGCTNIKRSIYGVAHSPVMYTLYY